MSDCNHNYCVILAGGIGSRFWPISRLSRPKQFLDFTSSGKSFLRLTFDRIKKVIPEQNILIVTLTRYRELVMRQIPELLPENLILEQYNRNTAPAITYATYTLLKRDPQAVMVATPSDLVINRHDMFELTLANALEFAAGSDALITLGVVPTRPDPNFGYIQAVGDLGSDKPLPVKTFTEKPDAELAKVFVESGEFLWNSGMFVWKATSIRKELERHAPQITNLWEGWESALGTAEESAFVQRIYDSDLPRISIDYAVMEKTSNAWVYPAKFKWADIGNWDSLYEYLSHHDALGNASSIEGSRMIRDCSNNVVYSAGRTHRLTAINGLNDFILIDTDEVLLICPRDEQKLKDFLSELARPEFEEFR